MVSRILTNVDIDHKNDFKIFRVKYSPQTINLKRIYIQYNTLHSDYVILLTLNDNIRSFQTK